MRSLLLLCPGGGGEDPALSLGSSASVPVLGAWAGEEPLPASSCHEVPLPQCCLIWSWQVTEPWPHPVVKHLLPLWEG